MKRRDKRNKIIMIFGKKGSGKSTLAHLMIKKMKRVIIFDTLCEYSEGIIVYNLNDFIEYIEQIHNQYDEDKRDNVSFKIICRYTEQADYETTISIAMRLENLWIVVEEITNYIDVYAKSENFEKLVRYGRHYNVSILGISQRCAEIPRLYTSQSDMIISFKQTEPRDIDYLSKTNFIGKEGSERIQNLSTFTYNKKTLIRDLNNSLIIFN